MPVADPETASGTRSGASPRRRFLAGFLLAILLPASAAAATVLLLASADAEERLDGSAVRLALAAEGPRALGAAMTTHALRPLVASEGRAGLDPSPLEPIEGGLRPAPPARIAIPAAGVDAVVDRVGVRRGALEVPDVGRAGWWGGGPRPGEDGRAVVIGHLDSRRGPGLFARVPRLPPGTAISITDRSGGVYRYEVVGGVRVEKDDFPVESVYGGAPRPVLVLVTCGGPYEKGRGYRDNVLVYARAA